MRRDRVNLSSSVSLGTVPWEAAGRGAVRWKRGWVFQGNLADRHCPGELSVMAEVFSVCVVQNQPRAARGY